MGGWGTQMSHKHFEIVRLSKRKAALISSLCTFQLGALKIYNH